MTQTCACCAQPLPPAARTGRKRVYCSDRCRVEASRRRNGTTSDASWEPDPATAARGTNVKALTVEALVSLMDDEPPAQPTDRLTRALIEARVLAGQFVALAPALHVNLGWRAQRTGEAIQAELASTWGQEAAE